MHRLDMIVRILSFRRFFRRAVASASLVTMILSKASNCSVFTSAARVSERIRLHIARGQIGLLVEAIPDNQNFRAFPAAVRNQSEELLGLRFVNGEILDEEDVAGHDRAR